MGYLIIRSVEELLENLDEDDRFEGFISLMGRLRSSKTIIYDSITEQWEILHEIDGSEQTLNDENFRDPAYNEMILRAMENGAFFKYEQIEET